MREKILLSLCLLLLPVHIACAAAFVTPDKNMREGYQYGWRIVAYRITDNGDKVRLCSDTIRDSAAEKLDDGRIIYHARHFTIIKPPTTDGQMILRVNNINVEDKLFSEVFTLSAGQSGYVEKTKLEKVFIQLERVQNNLRNIILY